MFECSIDMSEKAITVPYSPIVDHIRCNRGFVDIRDRPDLASTISEGEQSPAMKNLLIRLAQPHSRIFSVGCDVGTKFVKEEKPPYFTAGGYIQIMSRNYSNRLPEEYAQYGEAVAKFLEQKSLDHEWKLDLVIEPIKFNLDCFLDMTGSLSAWFHTFGDTEDIAIASREYYISVLADSLFDNANLACLE